MPRDYKAGGCNVDNWEEYYQDVLEYRREGREAMKKIEQIHEWGQYLEAIDKNTSFLTKLDPISSAIKLFCWLVGGTIILTALGVGAKILLTPTSFSTGMEHYEQSRNNADK